MQRKVLGLAIGFGSYNYVFYLLLTWLPSYLSFALHIDLLHSFLYTSVPWIFATITDIVVGGWLVDFLVQRGLNASTVRRVDSDWRHRLRTWHCWARPMRTRRRGL